MEHSNAQKFEQLSDELQVAAINLMNHLRTNQLRIRIRDTMPEVYITLGEGRHSNGSEVIGHRVQEETHLPSAQGSSMPSLLAKLRKVLAA